jgi:hypothetical protein
MIKLKSAYCDLLRYYVIVKASHSYVHIACSMHTSPNLSVPRQSCLRWVGCCLCSANFTMTLSETASKTGTFKREYNRRATMSRTLAVAGNVPRIELGEARIKKRDQPRTTLYWICVFTSSPAFNTPLTTCLTLRYSHGTPTTSQRSQPSIKMLSSPSHCKYCDSS